LGEVVVPRDEIFPAVPKEEVLRHFPEKQALVLQKLSSPTQDDDHLQQLAALLQSREKK
jgi:hypothetical protein